MLDSPSTCSFVQEPDTDLEVVLEKKGNMDEAHIDQVPSAPPPPACRHLPGHGILASRPRPPEATTARVPHLQWQGTVACPTSRWCWLGGHPVIEKPRLRLSSPQTTVG